MREILASTVETVPEVLVELLSACSRADPQARPSMQALASALGGLLAEQALKR
jgi:hypothetical protein